MDRTSPVLEDHGPAGEIAEGVRIERRLVLWLPAAMAASVAGACGRTSPGADTPAPAPNAADRAPSTALTFAAFVREWLPRAERVRAEPARVDSYLRELAALAERIRTVPDIELTPSRTLGTSVAFGEHYRRTPVVATQWRLAPGASLRPHNHPPFAGLTLGMEGECTLRSYALPVDAPRPPDGQRFTVERVSEETCTPGRVVSLIGPRINVHETLATRSVVRGIDLYSTLNNDRHFSPLTIAEQPQVVGGRHFEAHWGHR